MEIVGAVKKLPRYGSNYEVVVGVGAKVEYEMNKTARDKLTVCF